ncbi:MAG: tetratricopeptide repeat protein [Candidatus Endonucleobacter bathymodioli]|uniref:Tetratricopeptide repeat protein n=1 Tax=Candidatus Endonucleibacter bathymodioli TaxID=539814 RepID=A0AA90NXK2_9GAMM|nr:tetratricopeptide repeat protein [Candidatus Endonucleobacter bathymodioli]
MLKITSYILTSLVVCSCSTIEKTSIRDQAKTSATEKSDVTLEYYQGAWDESIQLAIKTKTSTVAEQAAKRAMHQGNTNKAAAFYARAFELDKKNVEAGYQLAALHQKSGNVGQAEQLYRFLLKQSPRHLPSLEGIGLILLDQNNIKESRSFLVKTITIFQNQGPGAHRAHNYTPIKAFNGLGLLSDRISDYKQAHSYYRQGLKVDPNSITLMHNLAYSLYLSGDWKQAEPLLRKVLRIQPKYTRAIYNLALVNARARRFDRTIELLKQFMEPHEAINDAGYLAMMGGDNILAEKLFQQAIDQAPSYNETAWRNMDKLKQLKLNPKE